MIVVSSTYLNMTPHMSSPPPPDRPKICQGLSETSPGLTAHWPPCQAKALIGLRFVFDVESRGGADPLKI